MKYYEKYYTFFFFFILQSRPWDIKTLSEKVKQTLIDIDILTFFIIPILRFFFMDYLFVSFGIFELYLDC